MTDHQYAEGGRNLRNRIRSNGRLANQSRRLSDCAFVRIGEANEDLNAIRDYLGAGLVVESPIAGRPNDQLGLTLASAGVGRPYREEVEAAGEKAARRETILELSYRAMLGDRVVLQPDLQWVLSPAAMASVDNALVFTLRIEWALWQ